MTSTRVPGSRWVWLIAAAVTGLGATCPSRAEEVPDVPTRGIWMVGVGGCGFRESPQAAHLSLAYWVTPSVARLRPFVGVIGSSRRDSYFFGGVNLDIRPARTWGLTPNLSAGYYRQGDGMDLGGRFQFRSGLEIFRQVGPHSRIGVSFHHISNAGLVDRNPGRESLLVNFGVAR